MSTSGAGALNAAGYVVSIVVVLRVTHATGADVRERLRRPGATAVLLWLCVAVPSVTGLADHAVYRALARRPDAILHHGELWRLLTGAVVQDGGVAGTVFNLVVLALIAPVATMAWGPARAVALFVIGDLGFNALATFAFQSPGAGDSGATFFLATSIAGLLLVTHPSRREVRVRALAIGCAAAVALVGVVLVAARNDAHGVALLAGLVAGSLLGARLPDVHLSHRPLT